MKKPIQTLSLISIITLVALLIQIFFNEPCIKYTVDFTCQQKDLGSLMIFFISLHTFLASFIAFSLYLIRGLYFKKLKNSIQSALRQGIELSFIFYIFINLNQQNLLEIWSGALIILIVALIEYIILSFTSK